MIGKELYQKDLADMIRDKYDEEDKKYRPSNGTEGMYFMEMWCEQCIHDTEENPCEILGRTLCFDVDDPEYPEEWTHDKEDGQPICTAFCP